MSIQIIKDKRKEFFRKGNKDKFVIVDKDAFLDQRLSLLARFILITLNDCNDKFRPCINSLASQFNVSDTTIDNSIRELKKYDYLKSEGSRNATTWTINMSTKVIKKE